MMPFFHLTTINDVFCAKHICTFGSDAISNISFHIELNDPHVNMQGATSNSASTSSSGKILELRQQVGDCEVDWSMLTMTEKIGSASYADL
jgi:hypothetical protein